MMAHTACRRGFSLIEMVIVVTMVGLLAVIAIPQIDLARYRVESSVQAVSTTLLAAQRIAVTRQHDVVVRFDEGAGELIIHEDFNNDGAVGGSEFERRRPLNKHVMFGRGSAPAHPIGTDPIGFQTKVRGLPAVVFHRNGSASESAGFYLTTKVADAGGERPHDARAIQVERATGRTLWYRYGLSGWEMKS